jgi:hypothetical protein
MGRLAYEDGNSVDLDLWEKGTTAYWSAHGLVCTPATSAETNEARRVAASRATAVPGHATPVDMYIDPVCPYTWIASRWLLEVEKQRDIDLRLHVMSLRMLNEDRVVDEAYRTNLNTSFGPSRVATAVWVHHGPDALRSWHTAFGSQIFDHWRYPDPEEYQAAAEHALAAVGLPVGLARAAWLEEYDEPLRRSHTEGATSVGVDGGTPVMHINGAAFFGPVLNAIPRGDDAVRLFDSVRLLAGCPDFHELKRTRTAPPDFA